MKTKQAIGVFTYRRLNNSVNGNPRFEITFSGDNGELFTGKTASDYSFNYNVENCRDRRIAIEYHFTPRGNVTVTGMTCSVIVQQ